MCLEPFFEAAREGLTPGSYTGRYYLGFRIKSPGADLVLFRMDGIDDQGQPRGGGMIFGYNGYNKTGGGTLPALLSVNNIRNTLLFEVNREEYQAAESFIDMIREQINLPNAKATNLRDAEGDYISPYYFSRTLSVAMDFERNGLKPVDFKGNLRGNYDDDPCDHFMRPTDGMPMVGVNCVYLANQIVQEIAGIDVTELHPEMKNVDRGSNMEPVFEQIKANMIRDNMPGHLSRECMVFDEEGELYATARPHPAKREAPAPVA